MRAISFSKDKRLVTVVIHDKGEAETMPMTKPSALRNDASSSSLSGIGAVR